MSRLLWLVSILTCGISIASQAEPGVPLEPFEEMGITELGPTGPHQVWVTDVILRHSQLFDADNGRVLATLDTALGAFSKPPMFSEARNEYYVPEAKYEWGHRGDRTDFVTVYDATTMNARGQIVIPTQSAESAANTLYATLLDGSHTLAIYNQFPAQSISIIDMEARAFVDSISTGGCAGVYATGERSVATLCGDGTMRQMQFNAAAELTVDESTPVFFDAVEDPVMMNGGRIGDRWVFVSFGGMIHEVDFGQSPPTADSWSGVSEAEKAEGWRPGGRQLAAVHKNLGRLYVLFHQGESGSHKNPGPEIWVFDLETRERIDRFTLPNMDAAGVAGLLKMGGGFSGWLLEILIPASGGDTLAVTQDDAPLLLVRNSGLPVVAVLDATSGAHLRYLDDVGITGYRLTVPR